MKQTAVEWFLTEFQKQVWFEPNSELDIWVNGLIPKAKEMEKEQIIEAVYYCLESVKISDDKTMFTATTAEQYYHETFKQL
jgi:hypothetical protein